jgi:flagellar motor protein MotB
MYYSFTSTYVDICYSCYSYINLKNNLKEKEAEERRKRREAEERERQRRQEQDEKRKHKEAEEKRKKKEQEEKQRHKEEVARKKAVEVKKVREILLCLKPACI